MPPALKEQLKPGGRLVIPVGLTAMPQELLVLEKNEQGEIRSRHVLSVSFVPLTGDNSNDDKRENNSDEFY